MFAWFDAEVARVQGELAAAFGPWYATVSRLIRILEPNVVTELAPVGLVGPQITQTLAMISEQANSTPIWGLRADIRPFVADPAGSSLQKTYAWSRMLIVAGPDCDIRAKAEAALDVSPFLTARSMGPYRNDAWLSSVALICSCTKGSDLALRELVDAARRFDPADWDSDGFYSGDSQPTNLVKS